MAIDQLIIGDIGSYDEYEANVRERTINAPKKKSIKETVPFSNETYDFSAINGEIYWEERTLEYIFEITADTPEELEEKKQAFVSWLMNVNAERIHDPFIEEYHFLGTFNDIDIDDSEIEKSTITATFTAYPYKISNAKRVFKFNVTEEKSTVKVINSSSHRITPTFICDVPFVILFGDLSYATDAGEVTDEIFKFTPGVNNMMIQATEGTGTLKVEFYEEVF